MAVYSLGMKCCFFFYYYYFLPKSNFSLKKIPVTGELGVSFEVVLSTRNSLIIRESFLSLFLYALKSCIKMEIKKCLNLTLWKQWQCCTWKERQMSRKSITFLISHITHQELGNLLFAILFPFLKYWDKLFPLISFSKWYIQYCFFQLK